MVWLAVGTLPQRSLNASNVRIRGLLLFQRTVFCKIVCRDVGNQDGNKDLGALGKEPSGDLSTVLGRARDKGSIYLRMELLGHMLTLRLHHLPLSLATDEDSNFSTFS